MSDAAQIAPSLPTAARGLTAFVRTDEGVNSLSLLVDGADCAACIASIEGTLLAEPGVTAARLNLTLRRLSVSWTGAPARGDALAAKVEALGYRVAPFDPALLAASDDETGRALLRALAVAGFASANIMMLSVAVWSAGPHDMTPATRQLLHLFSALVAVPALAYAGRVFLKGAWRALKGGRSSIDVPISLGLILTMAMSLSQLAAGAHQVFFDGAASLVFVLLVGRYLDFRVRARARSAVERLLLLKAHGAAVCRADGTVEILPAEAVVPGMRILVRAGERVPVDGVVESGLSELDCAIVTGESLPRPVAPGARVLAGSVNGGGVLSLTATAGVDGSHLAEIVRLVEAADARRGPVVQLADRIIRVWSPIIHTLALATFAVWYLWLRAPLDQALLYTVAVLILACPCALGLAVPAVQVVAIGALMRRGILVRAGDAIERLATINGVVFDKTGTLSTGRPLVTGWPEDLTAVSAAAALAAGSRHPLARAIADGAPVEPVAPPAGTREIPGQGIEGAGMRLGHAAFCGIAPGNDGMTEVWLTRPYLPPARFTFDDPPRADAAASVAAFATAGLPVTVLSGDRPAAVSALAESLKIQRAEAGLTPAAKLAFLESARDRGARLLMVGDGLNDAPALAAAHASISFAHGAPASQSAADVVLPGERLDASVTAWRAARRARRIILENLALTAVYNIVLIPLGMMGHFNPLGAAIVMAASSITVTLNALRAGWLK